MSASTHKTKMKTLSVTTLVIASALLALAARPLLADSILYNNLPNPMPPGSPSLGFQATQTAQFGDLIHLISNGANLSSGVILMTDWAKFADWQTCPAVTGLLCEDEGFHWPLTLNLYNVDSSSGKPEPGALITTVTQSVFIPWRPADDPIDCNNKAQYLGFDGQCYNGFNFTVSFDLAGVTVPSQFIFGIAYNTQTWGANPAGSDGPYDSLNTGLNDHAPPTTGSRPLPDTAYWNTSTAGNYADGGAGGVGIFRQDTAWTPYSQGAEFIGTPSATPEPGTIGLLCGGGIVIAWLRRRKLRQKS